MGVAHAGERFIDGDASEPGAEGGAAGELIQVLVGADVGGLHDLFGEGVVAGDGAGGAIEALVVAAHDDFKERRLAVEDAAHDLFVAQHAGRAGEGHLDKVRVRHAVVLTI